MNSKIIFFSIIAFMVAFTSCQVFVDESPGESETISIDEPTLTLHDEKSFDEKSFDEKSFDKKSVETVSRNKRATDYSSSEAYEDEEEEPAQGSGASESTYEDEEDEQYDYEAGDKEEAAAGPKAEEGEVEQQAPVPVPDTTPILPTRVVPTLLSPSFEDEASGGGSLSMTVKPVEEMIMPTAVLSEAPPQIYSSISFPEIEEGSGNEDYNEVASIMPTRPVDSIPDRTKVPDFSPIYPSYFDTNREPAVVTEKIPNQAPYVQTKLRKYPITAGKSFRLRIPEETFGDLEDGGTRNLRLKLKYENGSTVRNSWIGFDEENQFVYALPVDENGIGRYPFRLEAYDKEGLSVSETLEIVVRQYSGSRLVSHQFSIEFSFTDQDPSVLHNWPWKFIEKLGELYGDPKLSNIIVREVSANPYVFGWTNDTLTQPNCPKDVIRALFSRLIDDNSSKNMKSMAGNASRKLKALLGPQIAVKSVTLTYHGTCLHDTSLSPFDPTVVGKDAAVPVIRNPIDRINVTAGELLRFKVPEDTCYDEEDGGTPKLNLHLLTTNRRELSPSAWLQFDTKNQEFVGIPLEEEVGREEYQLVCSDRNGLSAIDGIVVIVQNRPFSERFGIEFGLEFKDFSGQRRDTKVKIVESLSSYFGDPTTSNVILKTFDVDEAKVVWYNKSLAYVACDDPHIKWVTNQMLLPDGKIRPRFIQHFEQYLQLIDVNAVKKGSCALDVSPVPTSGGPRNEDGDGSGGSGDTIFHGIIPSADYLLTFIIPAVIITCMLVLAILLACLLHKKRKAGKLNLFYSESLPPRVPVILQDELYEDQEQGFHKQPILLPEDTRPPGGHYNPHHPQEMDRLLQGQHHPVNIDFARAGSLSRPTPAYQRRQL